MRTAEAGASPSPRLQMPATSEGGSASRLRLTRSVPQSPRMLRHDRTRTPARRLPVTAAIACGSAALGLGGGVGPVTAQESTPPRLVVVVVVDQLPQPLLAEYDSLFTGGFRRILDRGFRFTQASHAYAQTHTAAGHATVATGVVPARHGVVANGWREKEERDWVGVNAVGDSTVRIVGVPWAEGRSPANLLREGFADWLTAADARSRVVTVGAKDRSAIGLAARVRGHVYWINTFEGSWVTSTYYRDKNPEWLDRFNEDVMPTFFTDSVWTSAVPPEWAPLSRRDTVSYEGDGVNTFFPHRYLAEADLDEEGAHRFWVGGTPAFDAATLAMAAFAAEELELGQDDVPDYLGVSLSQTDIVGHGYGPHSREQLDNLLRLDGELGGFLDGLDELVGEGQWALAFTSDHGALPMPEHLAEEGVSARRTTTAELQEMIVAARTAERAGPPEGAPERVAEALEPFPLAVQVFTGRDLTEGEPADSFWTLYARAYYPGRALGYFGDMGVLVRFPERVIPTTRTTGTDHRSGYWYDRHVPLVFLGPGIEPGVSDAPVRAVDIAPTLASLLDLGVPDDLDGRVILPGPEGGSAGAEGDSSEVGEGSSEAAGSLPESDAATPETGNDPPPPGFQGGDPERRSGPSGPPGAQRVPSTPPR